MCADETYPGSGDIYWLQHLCVEGLRASEKRWTEEEILASNALPQEQADRSDDSRGDSKKR